MKAVKIRGIELTGPCKTAMYVPIPTSSFAAAQFCPFPHAVHIYR